MLAGVMLRTFALCLALSLSGCKKKDEPAPAPARQVHPHEVTVDGAYHALDCGLVTAVWSGNGDALAELPAPAPKSYGVESLAFRFPDGSSKGFAPTGQLFFSDWRFDVFSPDCEYVALLSDHYGPYHVVKLTDLRGYLQHTSKPVELTLKKDHTAFVHSDLQWRDGAHVDFVESANGGAFGVRGDVRDGKVEQVFFAPEAPKGLRRVGDTFEVVP